MPEEGFNPVSTTTLWSWQGKTGKTLEVDSVTTWTDQGPTAYAATQSTDQKKPLNASNNLDFDADDYLTIASPAAGQNFGTGNFTISARFKKDDTGTIGMICGKYINTSNAYYLAPSADDIVFFSEIGNVSVVHCTSVTTNNVLSDGVKFTVTLSVTRGGAGIFYLDGVPITTVTIANTTTDLAYSAAFSIGDRGSGSSAFFNGNIYWVQLDSGAKDATWALNFHNYLVANGY